MTINIIAKMFEKVNTYVIGTGKGDGYFGRASLLAEYPACGGAGVCHRV